MHALDAEVGALIRDVAATLIMPRFRRLAEHEVSEKSPDDYVTIADRESEARLTDALARLLPGSRVIGEEAAAADPRLLDGIDRGIAWIVDPLDGTGNFAAGRPIFAVMVALVADGETQAGWVYHPIDGQMAHAVRGGGAYLDGARIATRGTGSTPPIAALATRYLPPEVRDTFAERAAGGFAEVEIPLCAGEQYRRIGTDTNDIALYWRALPWDHAPGALWLSEAGGKVARFDRRDYRVGQTGTGLIAAATPALWDEAARVLLG